MISLILEQFNYKYHSINLIWQNIKSKYIIKKTATSYCVTVYILFAYFFNIYAPVPLNVIMSRSNIYMFLSPNIFSLSIID
jgi:hypothetical protein